MNKIIVCGIPMKDRVDPSIYVSDDKSIPTSSRQVRFPINAFLEETMKSDDSIKIELKCPNCRKIVEIDLSYRTPIRRRATYYRASCHTYT